MNKNQKYLKSFIYKKENIYQIYKKYLALLLKIKFIEKS